MICKNCLNCIDAVLENAVCPFCGERLTLDSKIEEFDSVFEALKYLLDVHGLKIYMHPDELYFHLSRLIASKCQKDLLLIKKAIDAGITKEIISLSAASHDEKLNFIKSKVAFLAREEYIMETAATNTVLCLTLGAGWDITAAEKQGGVDARFHKKL